MTHSPHAHTWTRAAAFLLLLVMCVMLGVVPGRAEAQSAANSKFDHFKTGFPLSGAHATQRCESCHSNGIFKGTPRDCQTCHTQGSRQSKSNVVMPPTHIPTNSSTQGCDSCHGTQSFSNPRFSHTTGIPPGTACQTCHDGVRAQGKSGNHIATRASCDSCHTTRNWNGAKPDHSGFNASTNCASCHNGAAASGKTASHIPVTANCFSCHTVNDWKSNSWNHTQVTVAGACATCHTGNFPPADGRPGNHIPYQSLAGVAVANCDSCHKGGFGSWNPGRLHSNVPMSNQCASCHLSSSTYGLTGKPDNNTHRSISGNCENCHNTSGWAGAKVDHKFFNASTTCSTCHNGNTATGKTSKHIPVAENCYNCHSTTTWTPTKWNHTQVNVANNCASCHTGTYGRADGKPGTHIPYQSLLGVAISNCDSCHKNGYSSWNPGRFHSNVSITNQCSSCHKLPLYGLTSKPSNSTHINASDNCESCHNTSGWSGAKVDHSLFNASTNCATCHNGSAATGKPAATHIPVTANCYSCHDTSGWTPTKWNHTQVNVINNCASCHTGTYGKADGRPRNHIPYQSLMGAAITNCDSCHKNGYSSWNPGRFHSNVSITNQCATCHMLPTYGLTSKPNNSTHTTVTGNCESCHNTSGWSGAKVDHSLFNASTNCATCHNGSAATGKPAASHIPVTANCYSCHDTSGWTPTKWNHTQVNVINNCASCHTGTYGKADGRPRNHIPYQSLMGAAITNCDSCHKNGYSSWNPGRFHSNVSITNQCATCHMLPTYGLTSKPNNSTHTTITGNCESCHNTSGWAGARVDHKLFNASTNCATCHNGSAATGKPAASHIPVTANCYSCHDTSGWTPTKWNHTQVNVINNCASCHTGTYGKADGRPRNHIPYQSLMGAAIINCDSCHKNGYSSWNPGRFHSNVSITNQCATCHMLPTYGLTSKPNNSTHTTITGNCESCHNTSGWAGARVNHSLFNVTTNCSNCHNGSAATGKSGSHIPVTANCIACHSTSAWTPTQWNHTQVNVINSCASCHTGTYSKADGKPPTHIPYQQIANLAVANCDSCHKNGYGSWNPGRVHANVAISGQCATCHTSFYASSGARAKPNNHIPYESQLLNGATMNCNACHTSTNPGGFGTAVMNHNGTRGNGTGGTCYGCHNAGTAYLGNMERKSLSHRRSGSTDCSQSGCHRPIGSVGVDYRKWD